MPWYYYLYYCVLAFGVTLGAIRYPYLSQTSRCFFLLILLTFLVELGANYAALVWHNNLIIYRIFAPLQITLLTTGFWLELVAFRKWLIVGLGLILLANLVETVWHWNELKSLYPTLPKSLAGVLTIAYCLVFLYLMLERQNAYQFKQYPLFWLSIGWLLFSILTLINLSAINYIHSLGKNYLLLFEYIRAAGNIFLYLLFSVAFLVPQRQLSSDERPGI
jgi:hypothetical protein